MELQRVMWVAHHVCWTCDKRTELKCEVLNGCHLAELGVYLRIILKCILWKCVVVNWIKTPEAVRVTDFVH